MRSVPPSEALGLLQGGALVVDLRAPAQFGRDALPGSENLPLDALEKGVVPAEWSRERTILVVCERGAVSELGALLLETEGFSDVAHARGGLAALRPLLRGD